MRTMKMVDFGERKKIEPEGRQGATGKVPVFGLLKRNNEVLCL